MSSVTSVTSVTSSPKAPGTPSPDVAKISPGVLHNLKALLLGRQALHPNHPHLFSPGSSSLPNSVASPKSWQIVGRSWSGQSTAGSNLSSLSKSNSSTPSVNQETFVSSDGSVSSEDWQLVEANPPLTPPNTPTTPTPPNIFGNK